LQKALVSAPKSEKFAVKTPGATLFILLGKLSFVYESKEKMRHEKYAEQKKAARNPWIKPQLINGLR
jgi:hypothetical protein